MFQKAIIIGCPGAGKSTFARILSDKTHLPLYYLHMLWHKSDRTTVERTIFDQKLKEIVVKDKWIIDGNYGRTLEMRIQACETIFLLDFPVEECLAGAESRIGKQRVDMPWIETEFDGMKLDADAMSSRSLRMTPEDADGAFVVVSRERERSRLWNIGIYIA